LQNLFITPRLGSHTRESRLRASWYVAHRLHETLTGPRATGFDQLTSQSMDLELPGPSPTPQFIIR
jgi:D-3-phosphoglycerate dehydrogenase